MTSILNAKIHMAPGHKDVMMSKLCSIFQPTYKWLTVCKMNYCLSKAKKVLADEAEYQYASQLKSNVTYANILMGKKCTNTCSNMTRTTIEGMILDALLSIYLQLI